MTLQVPDIAVSDQDLQQQALERIQANYDLDIKTPGGAGGQVALDVASDVAQGKNPASRKNAQKAAAAGGTAAGALCGPGAPICGPVFATVASEFAGVFHDWITGARRKQRRLTKRSLAARQAIWDEQADALDLLRREYSSYLSTYAPRRVVRAHYNEALKQVPGAAHCGPPLHPVGQEALWIQDRDICVDHVVPKAVAKVQATYRNMQAEQARIRAEREAERMKQQRIAEAAKRGPSRSSIESAKAGARATARAYGAFKSREKKLLDAGFTQRQIEAGKLASSDAATAGALEAKRIQRRSTRRWEAFGWAIGGAILGSAAGAGYYWYREVR